MKKSIKRILGCLGVTSKYKGYYVTVDAVEIFVNRYGERINLSQELYPSLSEKYNTTYYSVESSIHTIANKAYRSNKKMLEMLLNKNLNECPSNYLFLEAIAFYIWNKNRVGDINIPKSDSSRNNFNSIVEVRCYDYLYIYSLLSHGIEDRSNN